ncbi:MAG: type II secretion system protein GspK [Planctomycetota bacterium]|nr:type II secretion system protein GspK [Planctomycetota bacterium]MDI6787188.1 type II secretion system protein GspK [Planctomycetota bacterium]
MTSKNRLTKNIIGSSPQEATLCPYGHAEGRSVSGGQIRLWRRCWHSCYWLLDRPALAGLQPVIPMNSGITASSGGVLVLVLWVITSLTILMVSISILSSSQVSFAKYYRNRTILYFIARAGINRAIAKLDQDKEQKTFDALKEEWSNKPEMFNRIPVGQGFVTVSYDYSNFMKESTSEGSKVITTTFYGLIDEERKININSAKATFLQSLFQERCGFSPAQAKEVADSIIDWRDEDDERRESGAENTYYQSLPHSYQCKNGKFDLLEELILVKGVTPQSFQEVKDFITIFGDGKININTASYPVLHALGLSDTLIGKIISCRSGSDEIEGTEDDEVFTQLATIIPTLNKKGSLSPSEVSQINNLIATNAITIKSNYFQVISHGYLADINDETGNKNSRKIICIIDRNGKIGYWRE